LKCSKRWLNNSREPNLHEEIRKSTEMPAFRYQVIGADQSVVSGELQADSIQQALEQIAARGLIVQSIGYAPPAGPSTGRTALSGGQEEIAPKVGLSEVATQRALLEPHMTRVLDQAIPLVPVLRAYAAELPAGPRQRELLAVSRILEEGDAAAAIKALDALPEYWIPLLSVAAQTRDPQRVLPRFFKEAQRADELRNQWRLILAYPLTLAMLVIVLMMLLSYFIVPSFREIFDDFQLDLSGLTEWVLALSSWFSRGPGITFAALCALLCAVLLGFSGRFGSFGHVWPFRWLRRFLGRSTATAQFSRFVADLLEAGIAVPDAVRLGGVSTRRPAVTAASRQFASELESGHEVTTRRMRRELTSTVLHALRTEMPAASRVRLLKEISMCHAERSDSRLSWSRGVVEPAMICVIAVVVGVFVLALLVPLYSLVTGFF
jgi:type II secretory pathway component PulF